MHSLCQKVSGHSLKSKTFEKRLSDPEKSLLVLCQKEVWEKVNGVKKKCRSSESLCKKAKDLLKVFAKRQKL